MWVRDQTKEVHEAHFADLFVHLEKVVSVKAKESYKKSFQLPSYILFHFSLILLKSIKRILTYVQRNFFVLHNI